MSLRRDRSNGWPGGEPVTSLLQIWTWTTAPAAFRAMTRLYAARTLELSTRARAGVTRRCVPPDIWWANVLA